MTVPVITSLYAGMLGLLLAWANWRAYRFAQGLKVPFRYRPEIAGNLPWVLVMMLLLEIQLGSPWWLHLAGVAAILTRIFHIARWSRNLGKWQDESVTPELATWLLIVMLGGLLSTSAALRILGGEPGLPVAKVFPALSLDRSLKDTEQVPQP